MRSKVAGLPLEEDEAIVFADWLRAMHIPHTHVANEVGGSTAAAKARAIKAKKMGQNAGVWDYELFIPVYNAFGDVDVYQEARVELKRKRGGAVSTAQKEWGEVYKMAGIPCAICKGADEAIKFVQSVIREIKGDKDVI